MVHHKISGLPLRMYIVHVQYEQIVLCRIDRYTVSPHEKIKEQKLWSLQYSHIYFYNIK